ncbi:acriflavin resistance protein [Chromatiales bacterium (ex Bugula neritina AB1)]|nr:acriflavin resistance protein [Chromatiales bacterium (ex Bugula neritina AB1)]
MNAIIEAAFGRNRAVLLILIFFLFSGVLSYLSIPKEAEPDVAIPIIYVSMSHEGISPEDSERLLIRPMETELQSIPGVKEITSTASEGHGSVMLEFDAGFDPGVALADVREKVDIAKSKLPGDTDDPVVQEINVALFPVLTVSLSGPVPERSLLQIARNLKEKIEAQAGVLEVNIGGEREEVLEIVVDPAVMETYQVRYDELFGLISNNNLLVAAGAIDTGAGRMVLKVPGVVEDIQDILTMPVKVTDDTVITFADVASVSRTFKDPQGFARVDGQPALGLEVSKRIGANIIETNQAIRDLVTEQQAFWPDSIKVGFHQDKSKQIRTMLSDLQNNILSGVILVMIVIIAALGVRSALLVGLAIPGSFLAGILVLNSIGFTLNVVVLFSLILVVGMLVDGAIVVIELADRNLNDGMTRRQAYKAAAQRMSWPIAASTATTLAVFFPVVFWPGMVGQFMKFLPMTVIICLLASLSMALIFIPVLGGSFGGSKTRLRTQDTTQKKLSPLTRTYGHILSTLLRVPALTLIAAISILIGSYVLYAFLGNGVVFFPNTEPEIAQVQIHARGDLSMVEKDRIVRSVEERLLPMQEIKSVYAKSMGGVTGEPGLSADVIGVIQLEFIEWNTRRKARVIMEEMRTLTDDIPGVVIEFREQEDGPASGKPINIEISSSKSEKLPAATAYVQQVMKEVGGFVDSENNLPLPGIEWRLKVDREQAARYGADVALLGNAVQMVTNGIRVAGYRPDDSDEELDIRVRFPLGERKLQQLDQLRVPTASGMIPITNFVTLEPAAKTGTVNRVNTRRVITVQSDVAEGRLPTDQLKALQEALSDGPVDPDITINFTGENEDQMETMLFLVKAFAAAIFLMALCLIVQFNSIFQTIVVLSAIVFSTSGVLLGLIITAQPFGIVMVGLGIIALAGIVVNNNIVLIDTYNRFRTDGHSPRDAALRTGLLRLRPVFLTAITTILGLMPMVLSLNIDLFRRIIEFGAPSTMWWTQLASAIAGGLAFATILTLLLTPCLLVLGDKILQRNPVTEHHTLAGTSSHPA